MPGKDSFNQGVERARQGDIRTACQLFRIALRDETLEPAFRANIHTWLATYAETESERYRHFETALRFDPQNQRARQYMATVREAPPPPPPPPPVAAPMPEPPPSTRPVGTLPEAPQATTTPPPEAEIPVGVFPRALGILDVGGGGIGTGFFVTSNGIVATTHSVTRGRKNVIVRMEASGQEFSGQVVRSYSEYDLAFIRVSVRVHQLMTFSTQFNIPDNYVLSAQPYNARFLQGRYRQTQSRIKPGWIPTTFRTDTNASGAPVFDEQNALIGMLTSNTSGVSPDLFVLGIGQIQNKLALYRNELEVDPKQTYCPSCGKLSQAYRVQGYYCETCGAVLPEMNNTARSPQYKPLYDNPDTRRCRHCDARVGFHRGRCLRCGQAEL